MANTYTAVIKKNKEWWIGWIEEVPGVNCQERTRSELLESLTITLKEALEMNRQEKRCLFVFLSFLTNVEIQPQRITGN